jgi:serine/threonine-protein kinase
LAAGAKKHWKLALAGAALLVAVLAVWRLAPARGAGEASSIVVLPFANLSNDPENEYLSDGLTEEIIGTLAAIPDMRVVARTSAFQFKGRNADIRKIGRDLSVKTALEGSVRREGQRIRVSAQLVSVADGMHLWSKMYDRELASLLEIEEDITRAIVDALKVRLAAGKTRKAETTSLEAHELYLRGRYFWNKMTPGDLKKSIECMQRAIALDPDYAAAHAGLADAYGFWINLELEGPWEQAERHRAAARKALELDDASAEGHFVMGGILAYDWDWRGSEREFRRALDLKPSLVQARGAYAPLCLGPLRRYQEAVGQFRQALEVDPLSVSLRTFLGQTHVYAGRPDEGIREVRKALELDPGFSMGGLTLALAYLEKSSYPEALQVLLSFRDSAGEIPYYSGLLGYTHARLGNRTEAERVLAQLKARFPGPWVPPVEVAGIYNGLGDREQALRWLERGCQQRSTMMPFIIDDPRFRNLYSEPRFQSVLGRMGLGR